MRFYVLNWNPKGYWYDCKTYYLPSPPPGNVMFELLRKTEAILDGIDTGHVLSPPRCVWSTLLTEEGILQRAGPYKSERCLSCLSDMIQTANKIDSHVSRLTKGTLSFCQGGCRGGGGHPLPSHSGSARLLCALYQDSWWQGLAFSYFLLSNILAHSRDC